MNIEDLFHNLSDKAFHLGWELSATELSVYENSGDFCLHDSSGNVQDIIFHMKITDDLIMIFEKSSGYYKPYIPINNDFTVSGILRTLLKEDLS